MRDGSAVCLRNFGHVDKRPLSECRNETPAQTALDARATNAIGRERLAALPLAGTVGAAVQYRNLPSDRTGRQWLSGRL